MSYIGRKPIKILSDTHVELKNNDVIIQGPLGSLQYPQVEGIDITIDEKVIMINEPTNIKYRPLWSTTRSLIMNMMVGVTQGHALTLKIVGLVLRLNSLMKNKEKQSLNLKKVQRIVNYH